MVILNELEQGSSSSHEHRYDVFLSFRGADTCLSFTDHLHTALKNAGLATFYDDEEIRTGEKLGPELESAIKASKASIIGLSKNYASSRWCLDELVLIMKQKKNFDQIVIPIFYHVEPTHVRKQQDSFGDAMVEHNQKMETETNAEKRNEWARNIDLWKKALKKVANLKGHNAHGRLETKLIEEIVSDIYQRIGLPIMSDLPLLIGMKDSIEFITSWLKDRSSQTGDVLTILGIGGIGKTSLAKYVYMLHCHEFNDRSFLANISMRCGKLNGLLDVQKQLCHEILNVSSIQVHDVSEYTSMIKNALEQKKVLIVLDDVDSLYQLNALIGNKGLHPGSKIIITAKNASLTERCDVFKASMNPKHKKYELDGLHEDASLNLLCHHAFGCNNPKEGYEDVSKKLVKYCDGHPLALEVLGCSLQSQDVAYWEGCIQELKTELLPELRRRKVLQMSFDSLPWSKDKELFLHIACFFVGMDRDISETILKACDIITTNGIKNLIDRCLLHIEWNKLTMHSLIQEMGRDVVRQKSPDHPEKRTRLWCHEDSFKVLKKKKGTDNVQGLVLDMRMLEKDKFRGSFELQTDALNNMDNLMILHLNYVEINQFFENFPEELRWLCLQGFPLKSIPSYLPIVYLVVLDMSYSNIESFGMSDNNPELPAKSQKLLGSLKILDLSFCGKLRSLGGFCEFPTLESLIVKNCTSLIEVCESVELCGELIHVDFSYCCECRKLPKIIGKLKNVKTLILDGCNLGELSSMESDMDSFKRLKANSIDTKSQTSSSAIVEAIPRHFNSLGIFFPESLVTLSLANNNLSNESFPMDLSSLSMLKELILDENPIVSMPNCVRTLPRLEVLSMSDCKMLMSVDQPPPTLTRLSYIGNIFQYKNQALLQKILFDPEMSPLKLNVNLVELPYSLTEIEGVVKIQAMAGVEETLLRSLGWSNIEFIKKRRVGTYDYVRRPQGSRTQMYYEFGIFSTFYGGEEMPNWIEDRIDGPSISFTIPTSPNRRFTGLNLCYVLTIPIEIWDSRFRDGEFGYRVNKLFRLPWIKISNITKNRTWIYKHYIDHGVNVGGRWLTFISHWMFGMDDMASGDQVLITVKQNHGSNIIKKCGVSFVYEDENINETEEEEDAALGYYKSWNHIIGGDLSYFQTTTGDYLLDKHGFVSYYLPYDAFIRTITAYKEKTTMFFKAFSQRKSKIRSQAIERKMVVFEKTEGEKEEKDDAAHPATDATSSADLSTVATVLIP